MTSILDFLTNNQFEKFLEAQAGLSDMSADERAGFERYKNECERKGRNLGMMVGAGVGFTAGGAAGGLVGGAAGSVVPVAGTVAGAATGAATGSMEGALFGAIGGGLIGTVVGETYSIMKYGVQRRYIRTMRELNENLNSLGN